MSTQKAKTTKTENPFAAGFDAAGSFEEFAGIGRANFEAFVKASQIASEGYGACAQSAIDFARSALEQNTESARAVLGAKSVQDAVEVQNAWARSAIDSYVTQAGKISELAARTTSDAFAPIQARIDETVTKATKAAA